MATPASSSSTTAAAAAAGRQYIAFVIGATGATGRSMVYELLQSPMCKEVITLSRSSVASKISGDHRHTPQTPLSEVQMGKLREVLVQDFDNVLLNDQEPNQEAQDACKAAFRPDIDVAFCCLGTTIKTAGSPEVFQKVDRDYVLRSAELLQSNSQKLRQFSVVTSLGPDASSRLLYPRTKGEVEQGLTDMRFPRLAIFRPSLLVSERPGDFRLAETIAQWLAPAFNLLLVGPLRKYRSIRVEDVARGMLADWESHWTSSTSTASSDGTTDATVDVIESDVIQQLADDSKKE